MKNTAQISLISLLLMLFFFLNSCTKPDQYISPIPNINLKSVQQINYGPDADSFIFDIGYKDGDGDIGLRPADTTGKFSVDSLYYNDLFIDYYEKSGNVFKRVKPPLSNLDTIAFDFRMPLITPAGKNKSIQGDIRVGIYYDLTPVYGDTIMFKIYIYDRALHKSNIVQSQVLIR